MRGTGRGQRGVHDTAGMLPAAPALRAATGLRAEFLESRHALRYRFADTRISDRIAYTDVHGYEEIPDC